MAPDPDRCQHLRINNETGKCIECDDQMIAVHWESETVVSAPNAAPCRDPAHLAAMESGEEFECHHPYIPDMSRAKEVVVGYNVSYECRRCWTGGTTHIDNWAVTHGCGLLHVGDQVPGNA